MKNKGIPVGCYKISLHCLLFAITFNDTMHNSVTQRKDLSTTSRYTFRKKNNSNFFSQQTQIELVNRKPQVFKILKYYYCTVFSLPLTSGLHSLL